MFELTGDSFQISGRGLVVTAKLLKTFQRDDLRQFVGSSLEWQEKVYTIVGVESYTTLINRAGTYVGFLLKESKSPEN